MNQILYLFLHFWPGYINDNVHVRVFMDQLTARRCSDICAIYMSVCLCMSLFVSVSRTTPTPLPPPPPYALLFEVRVHFSARF